MKLPKVELADHEESGHPEHIPVLLCIVRAVQARKRRTRVRFAGVVLSMLKVMDVG